MRNVNKDVKCKNFTILQRTTHHHTTPWVALPHFAVNSTMPQALLPCARSCGASTQYKVAI